MIVVYTKNNCQPCRMTKLQLEKLGKEFIEVNIDDDEQAADKLRAEGWMSTPVVKAPETSWSGFQPDRIRNI